MKLSQYYLPTLKEAPAEAELISHQLMIRAGLIRKLASGLYNWLPLGLSVVHKIETIVREELNKIGALEMLMPAVHPANLWQESGRWDAYGAELLRIKDRHLREFCLAPTHEEVITDLLRGEVKSYRQLPINVYQIQTKFRDEVRPRFGIMRSREFIMKDGYSFHANYESLKKTYDAYEQAYTNIFTKIGVDFAKVAADSGSIGGNESQEFHVLANAGEDELAINDANTFAANVELAAVIENGQRQAPQQQYTEIATPNCQTIDSVCAFLNAPKNQSIKVIVVHGIHSTQDSVELIALIFRGDHRFNEIKIEKHPKILAPMRMATEAELQQCGLLKGYIGPLDLPIPVICDNSAAVLSDFVCGANKEGYHATGVNWERDAHFDEQADLRTIVDGDPSPDGQGRIIIKRGIEVGHIFQLGDKYSKALQANIRDENESQIPMQMGCYGIGITRIVAAAIEQQHDDKGIVWGESIAPFLVSIIALDYAKNQEVRDMADAIYAYCRKQKIAVLLDDRKERPGVKFSQHELIGIPHQYIIGGRALKQQYIEYKNRATLQSSNIQIDAWQTHIAQLFG